MTNDDTAARRKRANRLRQTIQRLKDVEPEARPPAEKGEGLGEERPRDFVERRARELDEGEQRQES